MIDTDRYDRMAADIKMDARRLAMRHGTTGDIGAIIIHLTQAAATYEALAECERKAALER